MKTTSKLHSWLAAIAVLMLVASCKDSVESPSLRSVVLTSPTLVSTSERRTYAAVVEEAHSVNLGFRTAGQIRQILVKEGDHVCKGQLIATLDATDYRLNVEALQIQCDQARREVERMAVLFQQKTLSANDYEKAVAGLRQMEVQLQASKRQLSFTRLYAPTDGYIQSVAFTASEQVNAGTPIAILIDVSEMEVVCDVPLEMKSEETAKYCTFACQISETGDELPLRFLSVTPKSDNNQQCQLRLAFSRKPDKRITAGMNVEVAVESIREGRAAQGLTLPTTAVFEDAGGKPSVWVMNADSTLSKRHVTLSPEVLDGRAVILSGVRPNERIVYSGAATLQEGEKVNVIDKPEPTNVGGLL